jgi:hypothetical protein
MFHFRFIKPVILLSTCAPLRIPNWNPVYQRNLWEIYVHKHTILKHWVSTRHTIGILFANYQIVLRIHSQRSDKTFVREQRVGIRWGALECILCVRSSNNTQDSNHIFEDWHTGCQEFRNEQAHSVKPVLWSKIEILKNHKN